MTDRRRDPECTAEAAEADQRLAERVARAVMVRNASGAHSRDSAEATIRAVARTLVQGADRVNANSEGAARGAVIGAIESREELMERGVDVTEADLARTAAAGALQGAGARGPDAVERMKRVLTRPVAGVIPLDPGTFPDGRRAP